MRRKGKLRKALEWIVAPWMAYSFLLPASHYLHPPELLAAALPALIEILRIWPYIGIGVLLASDSWEEVLDESRRSLEQMLIEFRSTFVTAVTTSIRGGMIEVSRTLAECINDKNFFPPELFRGATEPPHPVITAPKGDETLQKAKELYEAGKTEEAIALLRVAGRNDDPKHQIELLKLLVYSEKEEHWRDTAALLKKYGTAEQFNAIAYRYWLTGDTTNALEYAKDGLAAANKEGSHPMIVRSKNNVAYYLAAANVTIEEDEARRLADEAMNEVRELVKKNVAGIDAKMEAKTISTIGYVKITFAKSLDELRQGVRLCEEGWERGASFDLFLRHMDRARARLVDLRGDSGATNQ